MPNRRKGTSSNERRKEKRAIARENRIDQLSEMYQHLSFERAPMCFGVSPFPETPPDKYVREFLLERSDRAYLTDEERYLLGEWDWCMVNANVDQLYRHLGHFNHPVHQTMPRWFRRSGRKVFDAWFRSIPKGAFGLLEQHLTHQKVIELKLEWQAGPGPLAREAGCKTKRDAWHGLCYREETCDDLDRLLSNQTLFPRPACPGGRGKLTQYKKREENPNASFGRLVWEMDTRDVALAMLSLNPVTSYFARHDHGLAIGKTYLYRGSTRYFRYFRYHQNPGIYGAGVDLRRMDSTVPNWWTEYLITRMREKFVDGLDERYDEYFAYLINLHCGGELFMPDGVWVSVPEGSCSGCPWVQVIQSILSVILTACGITREICRGVGRKVKRVAAYVFSHLRIQTLGDDQWFTWDGGYQSCVSVRGIARCADEIFQMEVSQEKSQEGRGVGCYFFLSRKLTPLGLLSYRDPLETLLRWKYSEVLIRGPDESYAHALGLLLDNPHPEVHPVLEDYLEWLEYRWGVDPDAIDLKRFSHSDMLYPITAALGTTKVQRLNYREILSLYFSVRAEDSWFGGDLAPIDPGVYIHNAPFG